MGRRYAFPQPHLCRLEIALLEVEGAHVVQRQGRVLVQVERLLDVPPPQVGSARIPVERGHRHVHGDRAGLGGHILQEQRLVVSPVKAPLDNPQIW